MTLTNEERETRDEAISQTVAEEVFGWLAATAKTATDVEGVCAMQAGALGGLIRFSWALKGEGASAEGLADALKSQVDYIIGELDKADRGALN